MSFFAQTSPLKKISDVLKEFSNLDFTAATLTFSRELADLYEESKSVVSAWRDYFSIPITDSRYLDATLTDIYTDYLLMKCREFRDVYDERQITTASLNAPTITPEQLMREIEEECEAIRSNKDNYADEAYVENYKKEHEELVNLAMAEKMKLSDDQMRHLVAGLLAKNKELSDWEVRQQMKNDENA